MEIPLREFGARTQATDAESVPREMGLDREVEASLRRRWLLVLPAVFVTYSLAYLDRANFGFGVAGGLAESLKINGRQTSVLSGLFFLGYFLFQIPGALLARRFPLNRVIFVALASWGTLAALTGVIREYWLLALDRCLLGVAESFIFPVMLHLLTLWFTRRERSRANTFLLLGNPVTVLWMSAITGFLVQRFGLRTMFLLEGSPAVVWGLVWITFLRERPEDAGWMSPRSVQVLEERLRGEQAGAGPPAAVWRTLLRFDVLLLSVQYFFWSLGVYGFVLWLPSIVQRGAAISMTRTGLLAALPYAAAIPLMLAVAYVSDRSLRRRSLVSPFLLVAGLSLFGSFYFANRSFVLAFLGLVVGGACMYAPYGPFFAIVPERLPSNVTVIAMALINSFGALGGFVGSSCVGLLQALTGNSRAGYLLMSMALILSSLLILLLRDVRPRTSVPGRWSVGQ